MLAWPTSGTAGASGFGVSHRHYDVLRRIGPVEVLKASVGPGLATAQSGRVAAAVGGSGALAGASVTTAGVWR